MWSVHSHSSLMLLSPHSYPLQVPQENLLLCSFSTGHSFLQGTSTCCGMRSSTGCRVQICSATVHHGLQDNNLFHHGLLHRLQGNPHSNTMNTSSPCFFNDIGVYKSTSPVLCFIMHALTFWLSLPFPDSSRRKARCCKCLT